MKKFTDFLEKNVQWVVLGLGVLYLLYMAWAYVIFPPVQVAGIDPEKALSPGQVDPYIYDEAAAPLEAKMREGKPPKIEVPDFVARFTADMNKQDAAPLTQLAVSTPPSSSPELPAAPGQPTTPNANGAPVAQQAGPVEKLPELAAAQIEATKTGMSSVIPPAGFAAANQPANNWGGAPMPVENVDKSWVTVRFKIDPKQWVSEWDAKKIPQGTVNTAFLKIDLERQELQPDGSWGPSEIVPMLQLQQQQNPPPPPYPAEDAQPGDKWTYLQWATSHQVDIVQPAFYQVAKGDQWSIPGEAAQTTAEQQQFDPNQYVDWTPDQISKANPPFTNEQKRLIYKARVDRQKEQHRGAAPGPRGRGPGYGPGGYGPGGYGPGGGGGEGGPDYGPNDGARPPAGAGPYGPRPAYGPGGYGPGGPRPAPGYGAPGPYGGYGPGYGQDMDDSEGGYGMVAPPPSANFPIPTSEFDPHQWVQANPDKPIVGWAHDETVDPGHTYRYRITYKLKNPVFFAYNVAKDPKLTEKFDIASKASDWSENVDVRSTIVFYIARQILGSSSKVPIQVFRWKSGEPKTETFDVSPGDPVGVQKGDVDYRTGWTLVDVRTEDGYILLMDQSGVMHRRNVRNDINDPNFKTLKDQAAAASASASAGAPGPVPH